jgi:copper chaperone NosL
MKRNARIGVILGCGLFGPSVFPEGGIMSKTVRIFCGFIFTAGVLLFLTSASEAAGKKPVEVKKGDKCRVCGMFVSGYPTWVAEIIFKDGTYATFDGPKDMFRYYFNIAKYDSAKRQADIDAIYVTEYYSAKFTDAEKVFFVKGSDVDGPMGAELVPVESIGKAREFMNDHRGKKILKFGEVTTEDLR